MSHDPQESILDDDDDGDDNEVEDDEENEDMEYVIMAASSCDRGRGKNKHFWKEEEIEVLVDVLQELASDPLWKVDGGFKNNYMVEVRKRMAQKIPNLDKEVNPHIDSKIKHLRNKYNPISEMLMQSGCQWDDVENKINCEKQWYDDWCKTHKNAAGLFNFKFPYLHKLDMVWGRDRATGLKAEDISEACEDTNNQANEILCGSSDSEDEVFIVPETQPGPSTIHATKKRKKISPPTESSYKKKKAMTPQQVLDAKLDGLSSDFKSICGEMASKFGVVADALTLDANKSECVSEEKMQEVMNELINIGISPLEIGKAVELCYSDSNKVKTFPIYFAMVAVDSSAPTASNGVAAAFVIADNVLPVLKCHSKNPGQSANCGSANLCLGHGYLFGSM
ncbi:Myb/SANT-like domain-containing protein [Tanacetum coccineum]